MSKNILFAFLFLMGAYPVDRPEELPSPVSKPGYKGGGYGSR